MKTLFRESDLIQVFLFPFLSGHESKYFLKFVSFVFEKSLSAAISQSPQSSLSFRFKTLKAFPLFFFVFSLDKPCKASSLNSDSVLILDLDDSMITSDLSELNAFIPSDHLYKNPLIFDQDYQYFLSKHHLAILAS